MKSWAATKSNGTKVNGQEQQLTKLGTHGQIQIGEYEISFRPANANDQKAASVSAEATLVFGSEDSLQVSKPDDHRVANFPPACFDSPIVDLNEIRQVGLPVQESDYLAIGGGYGSFTWVDLMVICGADPRQIVVIGQHSSPFGRYQALCRNSQIPAYERLRSNSDSCPDNIWGWPSYAVRESFQSFLSGDIANLWRVLWQVFNEPLTQTYTPKSGDVFAAVDREANRIDWQSMWRRGTVKAIRKTNDDRYVVTYLAGNQKNIPTLHIAGHIHLAVGYPAVRILPDLQAYRNKTKDYKSVVNAYENHEHIYDSLSKHGGVVVVRGRGIVASRIIQRLYELRLAGSDVKILHLMRSPKSDGNRYEKAKRQVSRHWEFQPFNWPKACWGGDLRVILERANARERSLLLDDWGGTTTADRHDWRQIIDQGQAEGWYEIVIGGVDCWERNRDAQLETVIYSKVVKTEARLQTDFIIDATGLEAKIDHHRVCPRN